MNYYLIYNNKILVCGKTAKNLHLKKNKKFFCKNKIPLQEVMHSKCIKIKM